MPQEDFRLRLAELLAALSLATDLGLGQPMEHVLRQCLIATRMGERIGLDEAERAETYYVALLAWVGCTAESFEMAALFGDDIRFRADTYDVDLVGLPMLGFLLTHVGAGRPPLTRARLAAGLLVTGGRSVEGLMAAHCQTAGRLADRLGLGHEVQAALQQAFARWDGKGLPPELSGDDIALSVRLVHIADIVEVHHRSGGVDAAIEVARKRSGKQFDPALVDEFVRLAPDLLGGLEGESSWEDVIDAEPALRRRLSDPDSALEAVADFVDLKSPYFAGHSRGVADLAARAAERMGMPEAEAVALRRAGLLHDLGRAGVSNAIWDKPGPLTQTEWERVRLHAYYTDRVLARPEPLARLGAIASLHHERLDGSGYHRGLPGSAIGAGARLLAAADVYHALTEPRPHRPAHDPDATAAELRAEVHRGRIDADAADAVLVAAGHRGSRRRTGPAGLTAREAEVLVLLARGASNRDIARELVISPKTAGNHIERIYSKLGVSTRAAATLFAVQHGLLDTLEPLER